MSKIFFANTDIEIVNIDGTLYALNGWNGEKWLHCWECADRWNADPSGKEFEIMPIYNMSAWNEEDEEFQDENGNVISGIIGYEIL